MLMCQGMHGKDINKINMDTLCLLVWIEHRISFGLYFHNSWLIITLYRFMICIMSKHFQGVNEIKNLTSEQITNIVSNLACYLDCIGLETASPIWSNILTQFEIFFRRLLALLPNPCDIGPVLNIMVSVLKIPGLTAVKVHCGMEILCGII